MMVAPCSRGDATVRELIDGATLGIAYNTALTTLDRLCQKHIVTRKMEGAAFRYKPRFTSELLLGG